MINLILEDVSTKVDGKLTKEDYEEFKQALGYIPQNALWQAKANPYFKGYYTTVCWNRQTCRCYVKKDGMHFPTGLISKALDFFKYKKIQTTVIDNRNQSIANSIKEIKLELAKNNNDGTPFDLYPYQVDTVHKAVKAQRGIIRAATGAGKTAIAAGIIAEISVKPTVFYVTSQDLLKQAVDEFTRFLLYNGVPLKVGTVGAGKKDIQDITVMTIQTAVRALGEKYKAFDDEDQIEKEELKENDKKDICDLIANAKLVFFDECQHVSCESAQTILDHSVSARWRYALSATPYRDLGDDLLIDACFGRKITDISASFLIEKGFLVKPTIAFIRMANTRGQKFGPYPSVYKNAITDNLYRNQVIAKIAENLYNQQKSVLILIQHISHGEFLQETIPNSVFLHGSCTKAERELHLQEIRIKIVIK